jgi:hypothetical protein
MDSNTIWEGRAIAQAVSRWLPTAVTRVRVLAEHVGLCGGQSGTVAGVLRVLRFPPPVIITRGWHNRPIGGRSAEWTQLDSTPHYSNLKKKHSGSGYLFAFLLFVLFCVGIGFAMGRPFVRRALFYSKKINIFRNSELEQSGRPNPES